MPESTPDELSTLSGSSWASEHWTPVIRWLDFICTVPGVLAPDVPAYGDFHYWYGDGPPPELAPADAGTED